MKKIILLYIVLCTAVLSCSHNAQKDNAIKGDTVVITKATIKRDTLEVQGQWMIFFFPTQREYDDIQLSGETDNALFSTASQFNNYMRQMLDTLHKTNWVKTQVTSLRYITIKMNNGKKIVYDRLKADNLVGTILTDGRQAPQVDYGVLNTGTYWNELHHYFKK